MNAARTVPQLLRAKRAVDDESQAAAAERIGITRQTLSAWERGYALHPDNLTISHAERLARYLELPLGRLIEALKRSNETA